MWRSRTVAWLAVFTATGCLLLLLLLLLLCLPADKSLVSVHITPSHYQAIQSQTMPCNAIHAVWPVHLVMHTEPSLENLHCCPAAFDTLIYFAAWLNAAQKRWLEECSHIRHSCSTTVPLSTTTTITPDTHLQGRNTNTNTNSNAISFANTIKKRHRLWVPTPFCNVGGFV